MSDPLSRAEYLDKFSTEKKTKALDCAMDTRKFEIELYWKRATYFWTFIAATLAGYGALQLSQSAEKNDLSIILSCLGLVFSWGWFCVNKGSKKWQENWERNVSLLEDDVIGPLFKTVWDSRERSGWGYMEQALTGSGRFSGSRINQLVSLFITVLWVILWIKSVCATLPEEGEAASVNLTCTATSLVAFATCASFLFLGRPSGKSHHEVSFKS